MIGYATVMFCLMVLLFRKKGEELDLMQRRYSQIQGNEEFRLDDELYKSFAQRFIVPAVMSFRKILKKKKPKKTVKHDEKLETELKLAGLSLSANEFITIKYFVFGSCIVLAFIILVMSNDLLLGCMLALFLLILGILIPRYFLKVKITLRKSRIKNQIPDVLDILSVSLEAGLGFDGALLKISGRIKGPFIDELVILYREIKMGKPRKDALKALSERSDVEEVKAFASTVMQAETLGISVKNVLKLQADQLRNARRELAEEKGKKAPIKMMLPLVLFVFPVIFIILLGPTVIQFINR